MGEKRKKIRLKEKMELETDVIEKKNCKKKNSVQIVAIEPKSQEK